ncbi:MAG: hypothetical protein ACTSWN_05405 [Promethearchaeota archaeon]
MILDFFRISIGSTIAPNRSIITGRGKNHGKICRTRERRKNSSCKTNEQATLPLDHECNVFFNFRRIYLIAFRLVHEFTPASQVQARLINKSHIFSI